MSQPESLLKRLAGPSTGKAGVKQDQEEINKIIYEASKGSSFFENEKRKDKELTEKIQKLLKLKDDLLQQAELGHLRQAVDKLIDEVELERDLSQHIVHVDMDAFYANVEVLDNPDLAGKPFGVGYGILSTASYEARKYGVRSAMPGFIAKKLCPDLIFVKAHYDRYIDYSHQVKDILREYDPNLASGGMDEAFLNITPYCISHDMCPQECVAEIRAKVFEKTKLTISAGIAPNKMLAKVCSDRNKPNGQYYLVPTREAVMEFTNSLSIRKIPGIGRVTERLLDSIGIKTCGDIYQHREVLSLLDKQFHLRSMIRVYLGIASNVVQPGQREERKSVGVETTFNALSDEKKILDKLYHVATELEGDLERTGWAGKTITLKYKLNTFKSHTRARSMNRWITTKEDLFEIGKELLMIDMPMTLRLIGLRATRLKDLRADTDNGIKRFFQSTSNSPRKKARLHDDQNPMLKDAESDDDIQILDHNPELDADVFKVKEEQEDRCIDDADLLADWQVEDEVEGEDGPESKASESKLRRTKPTSIRVSAAMSFHADELPRRSSAPPSSSNREEIPMVPDRWGLPKRATTPATTSDSLVVTPKTKIERQMHLKTSGFKAPDPSSSKVKAEEGCSAGDLIELPTATPSKKPTRPPPASAKGKKKAKQDNGDERKKGNKCPICAKWVNGGNGELNSHVDWCLSREAIKSASKGDRSSDS